MRNRQKYLISVLLIANIIMSAIIFTVTKSSVLVDDTIIPTLAVLSVPDQIPIDEANLQRETDVEIASLPVAVANDRVEHPQQFAPNHTDLVKSIDDGTSQVVVLGTSSQVIHNATIQTTQSDGITNDSLQNQENVAPTMPVQDSTNTNNTADNADSGQTAPDLFVDAVPNQLVLHVDASTTEAEINALVSNLNATIVQEIHALDRIVIQVPSNTDVAAVQSLPDVQQIEPNYYVTMLHDLSDPLYSEQWSLPVIGATDAWSLLTADAQILRVAVVDSGVSANHPDLSGRVMAGWDFVDDDGLAQDDLGHGTGVAGIIAANSNDSIGIAGIAPNVQILPLRVLDGSGSGTYADVAEAIVYATDSGANIVNLSLGGPNPSGLLADAVAYATENNVLLIGAAGNTGSTNVLYPAAYDEVVSVGSIDQNLERSSFSNYGSLVDLYAPGSQIVTTDSDGGYVIRSGTSIAAAHVTGVAALEMAFGRTLTVDGGIAKVQIETVAVQPTAEPTVATEEPQAEPPPTVADNVAEVSPSDEIEGYFNVAYGDPQPGSGEPAKFVSFLTDGINLIAYLDLSPTLALQYDGLYVSITGDFTIIEPIEPLPIILSNDLLPHFRVDSIEAITPPDGQGIEEQALVSGSQPFVMVKCRFNGDTSEPALPPSLFSSSYPGLDHYWRQISYDAINLNGTLITSQWYEMADARSEYIDDDGDADLSKLAADCSDAADDDVNFPDYVGIHFVFNDSLDCCAWGGGVTLNRDGETKGYAATWLPPWSQKHDVIAHEMGHAFTFPHSSGPFDNVPSDLSIYVSQWDVMSNAGGTCTTTASSVGGCIGQGTIAYHLDKNEWIPGGRKTNVEDGNIETHTLGPPQPLQDDGSMLLVTVPIDDSSEHFYTIEVRNKVTGIAVYDQNIPDDSVIIHDVLTTREGNSGPALVVDATDDGNDNVNDNGSEWIEGETFFDATNNIYIAIRDIDTEGGNSPINAVVCVVNDTAETTPPTSSYELSGDLGNNGYYRSTVVVDLSATDDCTNVENIFYTLDGGPTQTFSSGIIVGGDGSHTLTYWAEDFAGNVETTNELVINIDTTDPETDVNLTGTEGLNGWWTSPSVTVELIPTDNFSGVAETTYRLDGGAVQIYTGQFDVTGEGEHTLQFSSEDNAGNTEDVQEISVNIDSRPPVITIDTDQAQYTRVELITFAITAYDPVPGSGLMSVVAEFEGDIISDGTVIDPFWFDLGTYDFTATAQDFAGLTAMDSGSFELIATLESLIGTVERLCDEGHISNAGICNGLLAKLTNALNASDRGQDHVVVNLLNAFLHQMNAQNGKAISADAFHILDQDVRYVIESFGGIAISASSSEPVEALVIETSEGDDGVVEEEVTADVESLTVEDTSEQNAEIITNETADTPPDAEASSEGVVNELSVDVPTATAQPTEIPTVEALPTDAPTAESPPTATSLPTDAPTATLLPTESETQAPIESDTGEPEAEVTAESGG